MVIDILAAKKEDDGYMRKINLLVTSIILVLSMTTILSAPIAALDNVQAVCQGIGDAGGINCDNSDGTSAVSNTASTIVNIIAIVVGAVSVIMIMYAGFKYITSAGDANRIGSAKTTLVYSAIGLVIVSLAQLLVHFVLNQTNSATTNSTGTTRGAVKASTSSGGSSGGTSFVSLAQPPAQFIKKIPLAPLPKSPVPAPKPASAPKKPAAKQPAPARKPASAPKPTHAPTPVKVKPKTGGSKTKH